MNLYAAKDAARLKRLGDQWRMLKAKAVRKRIGGDDCIYWECPLEGRYADWLGGDAARTGHNDATYLAGASLLAMHGCTGDASLLEYIDGIFRWTRRILYTRGGNHGSPAAASTSPASGCCLEFLLNFYHRFKADKDPGRRTMAEEALQLGRIALYRTLAIYTDDPDETDNVDPTFLIQPDNDTLSWGTVGWGDTGEVLQAMAVYYAETGDPILGYFLRGALDRRHVGLEADLFHTVERIDMFRSKGRRTGLRKPGEAPARYIQPAGSATMRVLCGRSRAIAFTTGTTAADVEAYRFQEDGNIELKVRSKLGRSIDVIITSPCRNLRGRTVCVNGKDAKGRFDVLGRRGENILLRGIRDGDVITVGRPSGRVVEAQDLHTRRKAPAGGLERNGFRLVNLAGKCNGAVSLDWSDGWSWAGLRPGVHYAWGVPFLVPDAEGSRINCMEASQGGCCIPVGCKAGELYLFASESSGITVRLDYADGKSEERKADVRLPAMTGEPSRRWRIEMYPVEVGRPDVPLRAVSVAGGVKVFALSVGPRRSAVVAGAVARLAAEEKALKEEAERGHRLKAGWESIVAGEWKKITAATRGKLLRVAFLPPHEAYTEKLCSACTSLGVMPAMLGEAEAADPARFNAKRYPIAVYSAPETFLHTVKKPGDAAESLKKFLAAGGTLIVAARGYPFFYALAAKDGELERIKGLRNGATCAELELPIIMPRVPSPDLFPRFELAAGQAVFSHVPDEFRYQRVVGAPYRPLAGEGFPQEDKVTPVMFLKDETGKSHGVIAAVIEHGCKRYKGGRVIFLWGNMLELEIGPSIALDLMSYAIRTARLSPTTALPPRVAVLPLDAAGHDEAIRSACSAAGLPLHMLTPEEFADPLIFNPRNFPIAIHAVAGEYYLNECAGRSNLWRTYVDYLKCGGFLVACGSMFQFYYTVSLGPDGKRTQRQDREFLVLNALELQGGGGALPGIRKMFLQCLPEQEIIRFKSPMLLDYLVPGRYRSINVQPYADAEFVPIARVTSGAGRPFANYAIALFRFKGKDFSRAFGGAEMLWLWGEMLDDKRAHPLLRRALEYARSRRAGIFRQAKPH